MNKRQRVIQAIQHQQTDFTPFNIHATSTVNQRIREYYNLPDNESLVQFLGNHIVKIGGDFTFNIWAETEVLDITPSSGHIRSSSDQARILHTDEFGCVWDRSHSGPFPVEYPLQQDPAMLERYEFPDPYRPGRFDPYQATVDRYKGDLFIFGKLGFSLFERAWTIRGFSELLTDLIDRPRFVEELLDRVVDEWSLPIIDQILAYGVDGFYFTDDWGSQSGMLFSPELWRQIIKPRLATLYQRVKDAGVFIAQHSDGNIFPIMPDLIELGLDVFNPVSPSVYDPNELKKRWGDAITLYGGIDVETTLPFGSPDDVREEVFERARELGRGGGYILQSSHTILEDVPLENIIAHIEACHTLAGFDTLQAASDAGAMTPD